MADEGSIVSGAAGRYATALYALARESGRLADVERDLGTLSRALGASADLRRLVTSPIYSRTDQWKSLEAILAKIGAGDLTRRFIGVVTGNRRLFLLQGILEAFAKLAAHGRGETTAIVTSAKPMSEPQLRSLEASLKQALGRTVKVTSKIDPAVLGGLAVRVGSIMIDSTLKTQLNHLQIAMREVS